MVRKKKLISGEIFKESLLDVFLTDLEQISFSLLCPRPSWVAEASHLLLRKPKIEGLRGGEHPDSSAPAVDSDRPFEEEENSQQIILNVKIGDYVHCGDKIGEFFKTPLGSIARKRHVVPVIIGDSGRVITLTKTQLTLQKTQPVLFYSEATSHVRENEWVQRGSPILTLTHQTLVTGDIVQGIPRIEQLFEAVTSSSSALPDDEPLYETLHSQAREIFRRNWSLVPLPTAVRQALEEIQQIIVESIQKVYLSQGVLIADKHIEIIVKQMTSKGQIIDNGNTGFIINEVLPLQKIENANLTTSGKKAVYAPAVVGLTRAALNSDSFVSAASFQETTRVLTRDAVAGKSDFLRGLKEKVVIGDLISAGTGLDLFFLYTLLSENIFDPTCEKMSGLRKPRPNKYESNIRRI
jgi:DNA-directed RNA polymerase subunit beta'